MKITNLILLLLIVNLVGCSSSSKNESGQITDEEFAWISNDDFNEVPSLEKPEKDYYGDSKPGKVARETLAVLPESQLEPSDIADDPLGSAMADCYRRNFENGFKKLDSLYRTNKKNPAYWNQLGSCYYLSGEKLKALIYYNKARDLDENYAPVINNLGVLYLQEGKDQKALAAFKKASDVSKFSLVPVYNSALLYLKYSLVDQAHPLLLKLRSKIDGNFEFDNALAVSYLMKDQNREAVAIYEDMKSESLERPQIGLNAALAYLKSGDKSKAKRLLDNVEMNSAGDLQSLYSQLRKELGD